MNTPEFNLEEAISLWKTSLRSSRKLLEDDITELEDHVRSEFNDLVSEGVDPQKAFLDASASLGYRPELEREFGLVRYGRNKRGRTILAEGRYQLSLLRHYAQVARRTMSRHPGSSVINVAGLTMALAICTVIGAIVQQHTGYDRFHEEAESIHRIHIEHNGAVEASVHASLGPFINQTWPGVESHVRLFKHWETPLIGRVSDETNPGIQQEAHREPHVYFADSSFFEVFGFELVSGSPVEALTAPYTIVISESKAEKYFNRRDVVGEELLYNSRVPFRISAVMADPRADSHLQADFVVSMSSLPEVSYARIMEEWSVFYTYVKTTSAAAPDLLTTIQSDLPSISPVIGETAMVQFMPVGDIHLHSNALTELEPVGSMRNVILLISIGLLILATASINYINLSTARTMKRAREVAVRKVSGARRIEIAGQLVFETVLLVLFSLILALGVLALAREGISQLVAFDPLESAVLVQTVIFGLLVALVLGGIAGGYPALFFSRYQPAHVLKGSFISGTTGGRLRKSLVFVQFGISTILIVMTMTVGRQMDHVQNADLGFSPDNVVAIPVAGAEARSQFAALRQSWEALAVVNSTAASASTIPGLRHSDGHTIRQTGSSEDVQIVQRNWVDHAYFETLGMAFAAGGSFDDRYPIAEGTIILNETSARMLGWRDAGDAIGKRIDLNPGSGIPPLEVVGVVEDHHFESLHAQVGPLVFTATDWPTRVLVKFASEPTAETIAQLENGWRAITDQPLVPVHLEESLAALYETEARWNRLFSIASAIAVVIAILGLFGLSAFMSETRRREIGVRKALGATSTGIMVMMSRDFATIIAVSLICTSPLAYMAANRWLESFAYRTSVGIDLFILNAIILIVTGMATISWHTFRASRIQPAVTLRID